MTLIADFHVFNAYRTTIDRNECNGFLIEQEMGSAFPDCTDKVLLDESAARTVYLALKAHFEA